MLVKNIIVGAVLISFALPAYAENMNSAEILLGMAEQKVSDKFVSISGDDSSFGIRGSISLNNNFSTELSYQNYGETVDADTSDLGGIYKDKLKTSAFNFGIKSVITLGNSFFLNARIGISFWDFEYKATSSEWPEVFKSKDNGNNVYYGIGAQYNINSNIFAGVEYALTKMVISSNGANADIDVNNTSLSLGYKF